MKLKKIILSLIFAICLIVPCAMLFTACDASKEEIKHEEDHKCVATETYDHDASQHWFKCEDTDCDEKLSVEDHNFDEGVLDGTTKTYTCIICGYKTDEHVCRVAYKHDDRQHWKVCEDSACNQGGIYDGLWTHTFEYEFIDVGNGYKTVSNCICGIEKTSQVITFNDSADGSIEVIDENVYIKSEHDEVNNKKRVVFMAEPKEGRYFIKWQVKTLGKIDGFTRNVDIYETPTISYSYNFIQFPTWDYIREYTPIFTNNVEDVVYYDVHITGQNDLEHGVYYLPYYAAESEMPATNYYIKSNENLMLERAHVVKDASGSGEAFTNGDENIPLPYVATLGAGGSHISDLYIRLIDLRGKVVIKAGSIAANGVVDFTYRYFVGEPGEKISVYSDSGNTYYHYISGWQNEAGEIISDKKVLDVIAEDNITYYAIKKNADFEDNDYVCVLNNDNTYTIEHCRITNQTVTIPETINGIRVSAIADNAFAYNRGNFDVVIPAGITNIEDDAFAHIDVVCSIKIEGNRDNLTLDMFAYCAGPNSMLISITEQTVKNMINNLVDTFIEDVDLEVVFESNSHFSKGELAHYESGTRKICLPEVNENSMYSAGALWVWAHEVRHFYQFIAIGTVEGLDKTDLLIQPTNEQIAGWQTTYPDSSVDYEAYWNHPLEVDARDFATQIMGFNINL